MKRFLLLLVVLLISGCSNKAESPLPTNVVARINGTEIPADWFLHEFRSSFFKHMQEEDVRTAVLDPFLKRLMLSEQARKQGIVDQPAVQEEIRRKIEGMRAYMEYQLAMTEIGIINQAFVESLELNKTPDDVTNEELEAFFNKRIKGEPGAPAAYTALPPQALESIKKQIAQMGTEDQLSILIETWKKDMAIEVNEAAVQSVPMPDMKGAPPAMRP